MLLETDFTGDFEATLAGVLDFSLTGAGEALAAILLSFSAIFDSAFASRFLGGAATGCGLVTLTPITLRSDFSGEVVLLVSLTGDFEIDLVDLGATLESSAFLVFGADFNDVFEDLTGDA